MEKKIPPGGYGAKEIFRLAKKFPLQDTTDEEFARAEVVCVEDTLFKNLTAEDRKGHESFDSEEEMYRTYEDY